MREQRVHAEDTEVGTPRTRRLLSQDPTTVSDKKRSCTHWRAFCHAACLMLGCGLFLAACSRERIFDPSHIIFVIESNPVNLDPRYASDAQSQRIDKLLFDGLVERDAEMNLHGDLAESWDTPDALTYIFHLRKGVTFHDSRALTSRDVKATVEFMMNATNHSPKRGAFRMINSIEAPDAQTVVFHLKEPAASFLWNMERSAVGIAPADAGADFSRKPIGSGPYGFISQSQDDAVVIERNANYFRASSRCRFTRKP